MQTPLASAKNLYDYPPFIVTLISAIRKHSPDSSGYFQKKTHPPQQETDVVGRMLF